MMDISAALVGGLFDEDGVPAYARPVLFGTAGDAVSAYLPDAVGARFFVQGEGGAAGCGDSVRRGAGGRPFCRAKSAARMRACAGDRGAVCPD